MSRRNGAAAMLPCFLTITTEEQQEHPVAMRQGKNAPPVPEAPPASFFA
ncbi:hypothetical protein [Candidatus Electronema sp. JM]